MSEPTRLGDKISAFPFLSRAIVPSPEKAAAIEEEDRRDLEQARLDNLEARIASVVRRIFRHAQVEHPAVARWVDGYLADDRRSLLLLGKVGRGKTHNAYGAIRRIIEVTYPASPSVVAGSSPALLDAARPGRQETEWPVNLIDRYKTTGLLFLDDLGTEKQSEWVAEKLYEIIDHRYAEELPTIFASNLETDDLFRLLGSRLASRVAGMCQQVTLTGPDRRLT